jgi:hypothetical protein
VVAAGEQHGDHDEHDERHRSGDEDLDPTGIPEAALVF